MKRVLFRSFSTVVLLGVLALPACAQQDSPDAVIADCGGPIAWEKVDSCLERARVIDETNPSAPLQSLEAQLELRARHHESAQNGQPPGYGPDQGPPPPGYGDNQPPPPDQGMRPYESPPPDSRMTDQPPLAEGPRGDLSPPVDRTGPGDVMPPEPESQGPPPDNTPPPDDADTQGPN